ncbi:beta-1,4-galactosyltransferase galt-1-like [Centruroides sculpturatus]|uniref:beta-1,4-galactosyltransferase galt-1-like n=1 Tax=Centruroides sculpturatus TaxID=218467 RepID=UPI000C6D6AC2|nr:beta-1,4-galactosyltransferase galt-1-like [Centruroides sculpturatus]
MKTIKLVFFKTIWILLLFVLLIGLIIVVLILYYFKITSISDFHRNIEIAYIRNFSEYFINSKEQRKLNDWFHIIDHYYVYSAYWEYRKQPPCVRIIAIGPTKEINPSTFFCLLKYGNGSINASYVTYKMLPENHGRPHVSFFFYCETSEIPVEAALVHYKQNTTHWIKVGLTEPEDNDKNWRNNIVVCVKPTFGEFPNNNLRIAEFVAYYQLMGAQHIAFYDYKANKSVKVLINALIDAGAPISLFPWTFPRDINDAWDKAHMANVADCMYRYARTHQYVVTVDIDEFIVPKQNISLLKIINEHKFPWGTLMFRNAFFSLNIPDDPETANETIPLLTLKKTAYVQLWPAYQRSKCIIVPTKVEIPGIHYTWSAMKGWGTIIVNPNFAKMHHYRKLETKFKTFTRDQTAWRYSNSILKSDAIKTWKRLFV